MILIIGGAYQGKFEYAKANFKEGHQIRLEVTSSCFPMYDRNHNTGNRPGTDAEIRTATNYVHHTKEHISRLILPVIPEE